MVAAAATSVIVGFSPIATDIALSQLGPAALAMLRYGLAMIFLLPIALGARGDVAPRDALRIGLLGIAQFAILVFLFNVSLSYISAARAIVLFATMPLFTMLFQVLRGAEQFSRKRLFSVGACVAGVAICLSQGFSAGFESAHWVGDLCALGSAVVGAACSIAFGPLMRRCGTTNVTIIAISTAVIALILATGVEGIPNLRDLNLASVVMVLLLGGGSALAFWLWVWALGRGEASVIISYLAAAPIVTVIFQVLLLDDPLTPEVVIGGLLVSFGLLAMSQRGALQPMAEVLQPPAAAEGLPPARPAPHPPTEPPCRGPTDQKVSGTA